MVHFVKESPTVQARIKMRRAFTRFLMPKMNTSKESFKLINGRLVGSLPSVWNTVVNSPFSVTLSTQHMIQTVNVPPIEPYKREVKESLDKGERCRVDGDKPVSKDILNIKRVGPFADSGESSAD